MIAEVPPLPSIADKLNPPAPWFLDAQPLLSLFGKINTVVVSSYDTMNNLFAYYRTRLNLNGEDAVMAVKKLKGVDCDELPSAQQHECDPDALTTLYIRGIVVNVYGVNAVSVMHNIESMNYVDIEINELP